MQKNRLKASYRKSLKPGTLARLDGTKSFGLVLHTRKDAKNGVWFSYILWHDGHLASTYPHKLSILMPANL